jgi:hypothetical protein
MSGFRRWGCSPCDYISNSNDKNDGCEVSDDGAVPDDSSGVRKADESGQREEERRM